MSDKPNTRERLLEAGETLLISDRAFTMGAVAKAAGVSRQAVYLHFPDRYALLVAIVDKAAGSSGLAGSQARDRVLAGGTGRDALARFVEVMVEVAASHGALDRAVRATLATEPEGMARWARRQGRGATIQAVVTRIYAEPDPPSLTEKQSAAVIESLTHSEVLLRLLAVLPRDAVVARVGRAVEAALAPP